jgi:integrase
MIVGQNDYLCPTLVLIHKIMTIKIFIRNSKKELQSVCFRLRDGQIDLHYKSDIILQLCDWDVKKSCIKKPNSNIKDVATIRLIALIKKVEERTGLIRDFYLEHSDQNSLTSDLFVDIIDRHLHPENYVEISKQPTKLLEHVSKFIENATNRKNKKQNTFISSSTIASYKTNYQRLVDFAASQGKPDFDFSEVNSNFHKRYVDFLTNKTRVLKSAPSVEVQYSLNTIGNAVKALKVFISDVKEIPLDRKELYVFSEDIDNIYLNEEELQSLHKYDFSGVPQIAIAVDWFLLMAWTGSRISDKKQLGNIKNGMIVYDQQKTSNGVYIPLHPVANEITNKYNGLPPKISDLDLNSDIKTACKIVEINSIESKTRTIGGKKVTIQVPKYELVSSHTCRRSFCTIMFLRGIDVPTIMAVSGHKTVTSFMKYIKVTKLQHAELMAKKWSEIYK